MLKCLIHATGPRVFFYACAKTRLEICADKQNKCTVYIECTKAIQFWAYKMRDFFCMGPEKVLAVPHHFCSVPNDMQITPTVAAGHASPNISDRLGCMPLERGLPGMKRATMFDDEKMRTINHWSLRFPPFGPLAASTRQAIRTVQCGGNGSKETACGCRLAQLSKSTIIQQKLHERQRESRCT